MRTFVWDIECTNLKSDMGTLTVVIFGELNSSGGIKKYHINDIISAKGEKNLVRWTKKIIESGDILIGHNSVAFDKNFVNGVLARYLISPLPKRIHLDTMMAARYGGKFLMQSVSMANLADIFRLPIQKDKPSKHDWREGNLLNPDSLNRIKKRCKSDVKITAMLWDKLKQYQYTWRGI